MVVMEEEGGEGSGVMVPLCMFGSALAAKTLASEAKR